MALNNNAMIDKNVIYEGDACELLKYIDSESVNSCITSPPYYGLRDYGDNKQIGLEKTPMNYINNLLKVFTEVNRVLKADGTLWINISDSYNGSGKGAASYPENAKKYLQNTNKGTFGKGTLVKQENGCKPKDLIGIPWMLAFALRDGGWYWRDTIIWNKTSCMPESVKDRTTKSHEYILMFSKNKSYYYDYEIIMEKSLTFDEYTRDRNDSKLNNTPGRTKMNGLTKNSYSMKHKRSVWNCAPSHSSELHFATFPEKLIIPCIKASCPEDGIVLDPFMGSGTTAVVARKFGRNYIGCELNQSYINIANKRLDDECGMFK